MAAPYTYYAPLYHLENLPTVVGQNNSRNAKKIREELATLPRGERVWFIFSFVQEARIRKGEKQNEREFILNYLKENGTLMDEFYSQSAVSSVHLFVLR